MYPETSQTLNKPILNLLPSMKPCSVLLYALYDFGALEGILKLLGWGIRLPTQLIVFLNCWAKYTKNCQCNTLFCFLPAHTYRTVTTLIHWDTYLETLIHMTAFFLLFSKWFNHVCDHSTQYHNTNRFLVQMANFPVLKALAYSVFNYPN